jgi:hypothetical protein
VLLASLPMAPPCAQTATRLVSAMRIAQQTRRGATAPHRKITQSLQLTLVLRSAALLFTSLVATANLTFPIFALFLLRGGRTLLPGLLLLVRFVAAGVILSSHGGSLSSPSDSDGIGVMVGRRARGICHSRA